MLSADLTKYPRFTALENVRGLIPNPFLHRPLAEAFRLLSVALAAYREQLGVDLKGDSMHYYQFNIGDYHSHTNHLELLEDLAYRRMLDWCYLNETPLPVDHDEIARVISMRAHCDSIAVVLKDFFTLTDNGYVQTRIEQVITAYHDKSNKAKKSAEARWNKKPAKTKEKDDANALRTESEGNANHKPLTINQEPVKRLDQSALDPVAFDHLFEIFWCAGMVKTGKKKSKPIFGRVLKTLRNETQADFTSRIVSDIKNRIDSNQLGFSEMHPSTYLNGERWDDAIKLNVSHETKPNALDRHANKDWAKDFLDSETEFSGVVATQ